MSNQVELKALIKSNNIGLTLNQVQKFFTTTPSQKIKERPAKGGGTWKFVSGAYVTQVLNSLFGFNWSFEVVTSMGDALKTASTGVIVVQGRLRVKIGDEWITKEQYGRKEVTYKKGSTDLLDFGNDMKAAATDAKKKCASELGLFSDVYSQEDFFEAEVVERIEEKSNKNVDDAIVRIREANNTEALRQVFIGLGSLMSNPEVVEAKDKRKAELDGSNRVSKK